MNQSTNNYNRIVIASTGSGRGKTSISSALMYILKKQMEVHAFKCGPDYIDPMYHESILGICSKNLDSFFMDENIMAASFIEGAGYMNIIEGCMGLYDGIGISQKASTYEVASLLKAPIILLVDCHGMGASIIALIKGFLQEDNNKLIKGIFLNRISKNYYGLLKSEIENQTGVQVVGYLPKMKEDISIKSRHLGLVLPQEEDANKKLETLALTLETTMDINAIIEIAKMAPPIKADNDFNAYALWNYKDKNILVAKDEAFCFYYDDNIKAFERARANVTFFSPIRDKAIPDNIDLIYLGGGYPELHLKELSDNNQMLSAIRDYVENNGKLIAECGGFMYLCQEVDGKQLAGVFKDKVFRTKGLVRFGYITARYKDLVIKGHEFHHYDVEDPGSLVDIEKASTKEKYKAYRRYKNCIAGFPHFYFPGVNIDDMFS